MSDQHLSSILHGPFTHSFAGCYRRYGDDQVLSRDSFVIESQTVCNGESVESDRCLEPTKGIPRTLIVLYFVSPEQILLAWLEPHLLAC